MDENKLILINGVALENAFHLFTSDWFLPYGKRLTLTLNVLRNETGRRV